MGMTTAADRIQQAARKRRVSWAELARETGIPAQWVRSFATGHITKGDPVRIRVLAEALGIDPRELLALTDQLGAVEAITAPSPSDQSELVAAIRDQTAAITALVTEMRLAREGVPDWARAVVSEVELRLAGLAPAADEPRGVPLAGRGSK